MDRFCSTKRGSPKRQRGMRFSSHALRPAPLPGRWPGPDRHGRGNLAVLSGGELILITDNRNDGSPDSLAAAIRNFNTPSSLSVFTIADLDKFGSSRN